MNTVEPMVVMGAATVGSFGLALLVNWLMLRALFHLLPGRRKASVAQVAVMRTRRIVMPAPAYKTPA